MAEAEHGGDDDDEEDDEGDDGADDDAVGFAFAHVHVFGAVVGGVAADERGGGEESSWRHDVCMCVGKGFGVEDGLEWVWVSD